MTDDEDFGPSISRPLHAGARSSAAGEAGAGPMRSAAGGSGPGGPSEEDAISDGAASLAPEVARLALAGLLAPRKTLPPSLFYDEEGCRLFYEITKLPEYYLTRTEFSLLAAAAPEVAASVAPGAALVEYGASDETKADWLLRQTTASGAAAFDVYVPIDVAGPALAAMRTRLAGRRPGLVVLPVVADFLRPISLPRRAREADVLGFFPGSTIGNLEPDAAVGFLRRARETLGSRARLLMGFDANRDPARLLPAYDDPKGITAAFNRNLLVRLNREAGAEFARDAFTHRTDWNEAESRIEMHLVSRADQTVRVAGRPVHFARGETTPTENSYKYAPARMRDLAGAAGWSLAREWTDAERLFVLWLLE
jgi:L-histidine Nalpha-methyltransferase